MNMSETLGRWRATIIDGGSLSLDGGSDVRLGAQGRVGALY